jgi:hypothetical protein
MQVLRALARHVRVDPEALAIALAEDTYHSLVEVDVARAQVHQFRHPQPGPPFARFAPTGACWPLAIRASRHNDN